MSAKKKITIHCLNHPRYQSKHKPTNGCKRCHQIYELAKLGQAHTPADKEGGKNG